MGDFNKARIKEVSDKIQTFLDKLSKEEGIQMTMAGGRFSADSFTLKIDGKLLSEDGMRAVSDSTNATADLYAKRDGISFTTPHFIGSIWRFKSSGLVRVEEYSTKNRKYPYICSVYEDGRRIKATAGSFKSGQEVPMPSTSTFLLWFITDVEDDRVTKLEEETCDNVNDFISVRFDGSSLIEEFFDSCGEYFDRYLGGRKVSIEVTKATNRLAGELYQKLLVENSVEAALTRLKEEL